MRPGFLSIFLAFLFGCLPVASETGAQPEGGRPAASSGAELPDSSALTFHFLDVGQGDAVLVRSPTGQNLLYDGGRSGPATLAHLERLGIERLDLVVASHAHADHIGGLADVVLRFRPRFFMDNGVPHTTEAYRRLLEAVEASGSFLVEPTARRIALGEAELLVLPPPGDPEWGHNDNSVGLLVVWGDFRAILGGDAEERLWDWWVEHHPERLPEVQLQKASHHGSRNGDTEAALDRLRPQLVVISASTTNQYGHPHAEALSLYDSLGARVLRTDLHGTVTVKALQDGAFQVVTQQNAYHFGEGVDAKDLLGAAPLRVVSTGPTALPASF